MQQHDCEGSKPKPNGKLSKPKTTISSGTVTFTTNCGAFTVKLDPKTAPKASSSVASLAKRGFYDDTVFHRIVPGFVIQGGDPTATGSGGAGYDTVDKPPSDTKYTHGVVAMAKGPTDPAGSASSQFFVVTGDDIGLPPDYAVVGMVTQGMETVNAIEALGTGDGPPSEPVVIENVTVKKS